jgi:hypothetical protein
VTPITVVTPVGPLPHHTRWISETIKSVRNQTNLPSHHLFVNDGGLDSGQHHKDIFSKDEYGFITKIINLYEKMGANCVNHGVTHSPTDWVLILNSDDRLFRRAIAKLTAVIDTLTRPTYIRFDVDCSDGTISPAGQCFHRDIWRRVGGYPEGFELDKWFVNKIILAGLPIYDLRGGGIYWHRYHEEQMSKTGVSK